MMTPSGASTPLFNLQRHFVSHRTLRLFRAEATYAWQTATLEQQQLRYGEAISAV